MSTDTEPRTRILLESMQQFMQYGARAVKLDDIAAALGMSKKTIYQYFPDKEQLVLDVMTHVTEQKDAEICCIMNSADNPIEELVRVSKLFNATLAEVNPILFVDLQKYYPKAWQFFDEFRSCHIIEDITNNLKRGMELGYYRADIHVAIVARMYEQMVDMVFDTENFPIQEFTRMQLREETFGIFLYGIVTPKGQALVQTLDFH